MTLYNLLKKGHKKFRRSNWHTGYCWCLDTMGYIHAVSNGTEKSTPTNVSKQNLCAKDWMQIDKKRNNIKKAKEVKKG